jgi:hypothetical protein
MSAKDVIERARKAVAEIRKYELVADPLPTIRTPNAEVTAALLKQNESVGVLSHIDRRSRVGKHQFLVSDAESVTLSGELPRVVAIVTTEKAHRFDSVDALPDELRATIDPLTLADHENVSPVFYVPVKLVAAFDQAVVLKFDVPGTVFGPEIDLSKVALAKRELTRTTGTTNGHKHEAVFDSETGDGRTGAPTNNQKGHTHSIENFKVLEGDEGHTHWLAKSQTKQDDDDSAKTNVQGVELTAVQKLQRHALFHEIRLLKRDTIEERYVLGVVLEPEEIDSQGHVYAEDEVRKAAHGFLEIHARMGLMHKQDVTGKIKILESFLSPVAMDIEGVIVKKGTWLLGARIVDDELWEGVKNGKFNGWSIGGTAIESVEELDQMLAALTG